MKVHFRKGMTPEPFRAYTARQIPLHQREEADAIIDELIKKGVIAPVDTPTTWCSPAFFVQKPNGGQRLVTDFTKINKYLDRPTHPFPSAATIMKNIEPSSKVFMKMDASVDTIRWHYTRKAPT